MAPLEDVSIWQRVIINQWHYISPVKESVSREEGCLSFFSVLESCGSGNFTLGSRAVKSKLLHNNISER